MATSTDDRARYSGWGRDHQGDCWSLAVYLLGDQTVIICSRGDVILPPPMAGRHGHGASRTIGTTTITNVM